MSGQGREGTDRRPNRLRQRKQISICARQCPLEQLRLRARLELGPIDFIKAEWLVETGVEPGLTALGAVREALPDAASSRRAT